MLGVKNQWFCILDAGTHTDILDTWAVTRITIIEEAGLSLPTFSLEFSTMDQEVADSILNEGTILTLRFGKDQSQGPHYTCQIAPTNVVAIPQMGALTHYQIKLKGILSKNDFISNQKVRILPGTSSSIIQRVGSESGLRVEADSTMDHMNWIQYDITNQQFCNEVIEHGYINNESSMVSGITRDARLLYKDLTKIKRTGSPKHRLAAGAVFGDNEVGNFSLHSNSGILNVWAGYNRSIRETDQVFKRDGIKIPSPKQRSILSNYFNISSNKTYQREFEIDFFDQDNVHAKFNQAKAQNLVGMANNSLVSTKCTVIDRFMDVHLFDIVEVNVQKIVEKSMIGSYMSGLYVVSRIQFNIDRKFSMTVTCAREGINTDKRVHLRK